MQTTGASLLAWRLCSIGSVQAIACDGRGALGLLYLAAIRAPMRDTGVVATWVGLIGVLAGALIAFGGQYLTGRTERQERSAAILLEQCAVLIASSEDFRGRVWEERNFPGSDAVGKWDGETYRLAEARLRLLSQESDFLAALEALRESGKALAKAWDHAASDEAAVDSAWLEYRSAITQFVTVGSRLIRPRSGPSFR